MSTPDGREYRVPEGNLDRPRMQTDVEKGTQGTTFDFAKHGRIKTHRYRSYFEAQPGSPIKCAFCGRIIRYVYALKGKDEKTFLIGSCEFERYKGTKQYAALKAAHLLQECRETMAEQPAKEKLTW